MYNITQKNRDDAAKRVSGDDAKAVAFREAILAGQADESPAVQAAAFYDKPQG